MELNEKLTALRKEKGLSQLELAEELVVSRQAVSKWEVGDTVPSTPNLQRLAKLYGVPLEYLANDELEEIPTGSIEETPKRDTSRAEVPVDTLTASANPGHEKSWKGLAVGALALCVILSAILFYIKVSEKPGESQGSSQSVEIKEKYLDEHEITGNFDLEW